MLANTTHRTVEPLSPLGLTEMQDIELRTLVREEARNVLRGYLHQQRREQEDQQEQARVADAARARQFSQTLPGGS